MLVPQLDTNSADKTNVKTSWSHESVKLSNGTGKSVAENGTTQRLQYSVNPIVDDLVHVQFTYECLPFVFMKRKTLCNN